MMLQISFLSGELNNIVHDLKSSTFFPKYLDWRKKIFPDSAYMTFYCNMYQENLWREGLCILYRYIAHLLQKLEVSATNPKIGDFLLSAANDHWNVLSCTTTNSLPLYPSLTCLQWRNIRSGKICAGENLLWSVSAIYLCRHEYGNIFVWTKGWVYQVHRLSLYVG